MTVFNAAASQPVHRSAASTGGPILQVEDLNVSIRSDGGEIPVLRDVNLTVDPGEVLGIVGESGSGKTMTASAIMRILEPPAEVRSGRIMFQGEDLLAMPPERLRQVRGTGISMVFQDPMSVLNPVLRVETHLTEAIRSHDPATATDTRNRAVQALERVGIPAPRQRLRAYPHELSGGMRQRVAIAIALLHEPSLIIADEPTTALDVTIQAQILSEFRGLVDRIGASVIWISHDLAVIAAIADRIAVMYAGRVVEQGPARALLTRPSHPYTSALIQSLPSAQRGHGRLEPIEGAAPSAGAIPEGCPFRPRCPRARELCSQTPEPHKVDDGHIAWCFFPLDDGDSEGGQAP